jgi:hypothetical protein
MKKHTLREKVEAYEALLHRLNFHRTITMDEKAVSGIMSLVDAWSAAHGRGGSSPPSRREGEEERERRVSAAFDRLRSLP